MGTHMGTWKQREAAAAAELLAALHPSSCTCEVEDLQQQLPPGSQWRMVTSIMR